MSKAIVTKYLPPTNYKGARIKATSTDGSVTLSYDYEVSAERNHLDAAESLALTYWNEHLDLIGGERPDGKGFCFVQNPKENDSWKDYGLGLEPPF